MSKPKTKSFANLWKSAFAMLRHNKKRLIKIRIESIKEPTTWEDLLQIEFIFKKEKK